MRRIAALLALAALPALTSTPALAHRLDEYLQATLVSVERNRMEAQMTLTPGVAVFPFLVPDIDANGDGVLSDAEQRAYAARVMGDLSVLSDGRRLTPQLTSLRFPALSEMKEGRGEIRITFSAVLPEGYRDRELTIENRHKNGISAYLVNCLVPSDPRVEIVAQNRNYSQSIYRLEYRRTDEPMAAWWSASGLWLGPIGLVLIMRIVALRRRSSAPLEV
jgi:hypothetical protein